MNRLKARPEDQASTVREPTPDGNKGAFDALLRQAVLDEAGAPEGETSHPASS